MDTAFLKKQLKHDRRVQTEVYEAYYKRVYASCLRIVRDRHRAEDFMQEAFIQAFGSIDSFRGDAGLCTWICRIAINKCLDFLKKKKVDLSFDPDWERLHHESFHMDEDSEGYYLAMVKEALSQLPEGCCLIFNLHVFEEMEHGEIASRLGIKEASARMQYQRAKSKIKEIINTNGRA